MKRGLWAAAVLLAGCGSLVQKGDEAAARRDWDGAIDSYQKAAVKESDVQIIQEIQRKIENVKKQAGAWWAQEARHRLDSREYDKAYEAAEKAYGYDRAAATSSLRAEVRREYARHLFHQGKAQLDNGFLDDALKSIERAHGLDPTPEYTTLLQDLRARMRKQK